MSLSADYLMERTRLKLLMRRWRVLFIIAVFASIFFASRPSGSLVEGVPAKPYVARIVLSGILFEDSQQKQSLERLAKDVNAKAVVVYINSPGGTMTGSEILYNSLKNIAKIKPLVSVIGSLGASGGYMAALAGEQIFAQKSSLTGSIGVMLQSVEVTELAKKVGVSLKTFKSSPLKGEPSPLSKLTPNVETSINESIADSYAQFVDMVQESRNLTPKNLKDASNGRIFTGRQAKALGLIDHYGDEKDALRWLQEEKEIEPGLQLYTFDLVPEKEGLEKLLSVFSGDNSILSFAQHRGMMVLWQPSAF